MRVRSSRNAVVLALALTAAMSACASGGGGSNRPPGATQNRIVKAELDELGQLSALQAIQRLRPQWLISRSGDAPVLYVDGARRGSANDLSSMRLNDIDQMEYMSASDATTRYGTGHAGGAIMVTTRR